MNIEARGEGCRDCLGLILWLTFVTSLPGKAFVLYPLGTVGKVPGGLEHRSQQGKMQRSSKHEDGWGLSTLSYQR